MKRKIIFFMLFLLTFSVLSVFADEIQFDMAIFYSKNKPYLEIYLSLPLNLLKFSDVNNKYSCEVSYILLIKDSEGNFITEKSTVANFSTYEKYKSESPYLFLPAQLWARVNQGTYSFTITAEDLNSDSKWEISRDVEVEYDLNEIKTSDIEFATEINDTMTRDQFFKNGLHIVPIAEQNIYSGTDIYYYIEIYNYSTNNPQPFEVRHYLKNNKGEVLFDEEEMVTPNQSEISWAKMIETDNYKNGEYTLFIEVESKSGVKVNKSKTFYITSPKVDFPFEIGKHWVYTLQINPSDASIVDRFAAEVKKSEIEQELVDDEYEYSGKFLTGYTFTEIKKTLVFNGYPVVLVHSFFEIEDKTKAEIYRLKQNTYFHPDLTLAYNKIEAYSSVKNLWTIVETDFTAMPVVTVSTSGTEHPKPHKFKEDVNKPLIQKIEIRIDDIVIKPVIAGAMTIFFKQFNLGESNKIDILYFKHSRGNFQALLLFGTNVSIKYKETETITVGSKVVSARKYSLGKFNIDVWLDENNEVVKIKDKNTYLEAVIQ